MINFYINKKNKGKEKEKGDYNIKDDNENRNCNSNIKQKNNLLNFKKTGIIENINFEEFIMENTILEIILFKKINENNFLMQILILNFHDQNSFQSKYLNPEIYLKTIDCLTKIPELIKISKNYILIKNDDKSSFELFLKKSKLKTDLEFFNTFKEKKIKTLPDDLLICFSNDKKQFEIFDFNIKDIIFTIDNFGKSFFKS